MIYFDCNVCIGKHGTKPPLEPWRTEDILRAMERCGIAGALVYHGMAKDYAPKYGNGLLAAELKKSSRLFGCYVVGPNQAEDFYGPEEMLADIRRIGCVAARMFPKTHHYAADERTMGGVYRMLEGAGLPLLVEYNEIDMRDLAGALGGHPGLKVILLGVPWSHERILFPLMDSFPNLHTDLSYLQSNRIIEILHGRYGLGRVLFGSNLPRQSAGAARAFADFSELPGAELQKFAGGNLSAMTGVTPSPAGELKGGRILRGAAAGRPCPVPVIDSHAHYQPPGHATGAGYMMREGDINHMVRFNDRLGVEKFCVAPWIGIWSDCEEGNQAALAMQEQYPGRVYPYLLIDPNYVDDIEGTARLYHLEHGFPGIKMFYARTGARYNDPMFAPWWALAEQYRLFTLMDNCGYPTFLQDVEELVARYPNVSFFLDHAGQSFEIATRYAPYAREYLNVYLQLTYTTVTEGVIEYFCREGLADKVMYGTDAPMRDMRPQLSWVAFAGVSEEDKAKILGGNMQRVLNRRRNSRLCGHGGNG